MKKLFVMSDTHKNTDIMKKLQNIMIESDYVIHLGDYNSDTAFLKKELGDKLITVNGNCDVFGSTERVINIDGVKLFLTHGHKYNVKRTLENIKNETHANECKICFFGHTHRAEIIDCGEFMLINPGSLSDSVSGVLSYAYVIIWNNKIIPKIVEI